MNPPASAASARPRNGPTLHRHPAGAPPGAGGPGTTGRAIRRAIHGAPLPVLFAAGLAIPTTSCSLVTGIAVNSLAEVLAEGEAVYRSDDDLELVGSAMAFNLKTLETLLLSSPDHRGMLLTATKSFLLYGYGFVEPGIYDLDFTQFEEEQAVRRRAAKFYQRAAEFGFRGLEVNHPGIADRLRSNPEAAASELETDDAPLALWTGTAIGARIAMATHDPEATADVAVVGALLHRSRELDDTVDAGVVYDYLCLYEAGRVGGSLETARGYYEAALPLAASRLPVIWGTWAEAGAIPAQDRAEFERLLTDAIEYDLDDAPEGRLLNRVAQARARWLLANADDHFLETTEPEDR